ncbi:GATOR2 complex protein WDR59-like [Amphiura filiformis]|uniref:GATOR2 complex protein WDR59-like n=1 Tax=Amphiura filiformis TaxID=82378 RepID=UPI003B221E5E
MCSCPQKQYYRMPWQTNGAMNTKHSEFKEPSQATAMAVDAQGQMAVLAGRRSLEIVNLDDPGARTTKIRRKSTVKWDVNVAEWSPHESPNQFATAANQVVDIFTHKDGDWIQDHSLKAHTRAVSDLNWAPFENDLLATCSVDTYIFLWDMRAPKKPAASFSTFAGAGQVKWNKKNLNFFATVHEGDIRLWDKRKSGQAIQYVSAHLSKIHGLDWDPDSEFSLATASQDCTAKFWNISEARKPTLELRSSSPVWRARYTPFGDGILTTSVPQLRRGENTLLLWTCSNLSSPVHSFPGHTDDVLEFQWRQLHDGSNDYQLITWCRDQSLRMWRVEPHLQRLCGVDIPEVAGSELSTSIDVITPTTTQETGSPSSPDGKLNKSPSASQTEVVTVDAEGAEVEGSIEGKGHGSSSSLVVYQQQQQVILEDEFNVLLRNQQNVSLEQLDAQSRTCLLSAIGGQHTIRIKAVFPPNYPNKVPPKWSFLLMTSLDSQLKSKLLKVLDEICSQQVANNQYCLQMCLQHLDTFVESLKGSKSPSKKTSSQSTKSVAGTESSGIMTNYGTFTDYNIPFPRTTGARFSGVDKLVIFTRVGSTRKTGNNQKTPRSLTALGTFNKPFFAFGQPVTQSVNEPVSLNSFYKERDRVSKMEKPVSLIPSIVRRESDTNIATNNSKQTQSCGPVVVYDASYFLPIRQELAASYVLNPNDIPAMCTKNAAAARAVGRKDLVQIWSLAAVSSNPNLKCTENPDEGSPWAKHPFGRQLLKSLLDHYSSIHDVQTLAMLCCVFGSLHNQQKEDDHHERDLERGVMAIESNMYFVTDSNDPIFTQDWSGDSTQLQSFSESPDDYRLNPMRDPRDIEREKHRLSTKLLDPNLSHQFDAFKRHYAEILYRWKLLRARAEILNYVSMKSLNQSEIVFSDFGVYCQKCSKQVYTVKCDGCRSFSFQCAICHVAVKGSSSFCLVCGHGGHSLHMMEWFKHESVCPTGCGCMCPQQAKQICEDAPISPR